jgi:hypothetical protein
MARLPLNEKVRYLEELADEVRRMCPPSKNGSLEMTGYGTRQWSGVEARKRVRH